MKRVVVEPALVVLAAIALFLLLNSAWFRSCCEPIERALSIALLPGVLLAMVMGGGAHSADPAHVMIGITVELVALYGIGRLAGRMSKR